MYFSIFRRADDVTRTMSKGGGGACECPRVGVFVIFWRADDARRTMSKGGGVLVNVLTPPPPFRKSCIRACQHITPGTHGHLGIPDENISG